jgi:hypothetical protein
MSVMSAKKSSIKKNVVEKGFSNCAPDKFSIVSIPFLPLTVGLEPSIYPVGACKIDKPS